LRFCGQRPDAAALFVCWRQDGSAFVSGGGVASDGNLSISWTSFAAIYRSAIAQLSTTVVVVDGNLRVQVVPNTTATRSAFYSVKYLSDGRIQFSETWAVPSSVARCGCAMCAWRALRPVTRKTYTVVRLPSRAYSGQRSAVRSRMPELKTDR